MNDLHKFRNGGGVFAAVAVAADGQRQLPGRLGQGERGSGHRGAPEAEALQVRGPTTKQIKVIFRAV